MLITQDTKGGRVESLEQGIEEGKGNNNQGAETWHIMNFLKTLKDGSKAQLQ